MVQFRSLARANYHEELPSLGGRKRETRGVGAKCFVRIGG